MKHVIGFLFGLVVVFAFISCEKEEASLDEEPVSVMTAEDEATAEYLTEYTESLEDEAIEFRTLDTPCVEVIWAAPKGTFPNTVTIDFGDGCVGPNGHLRKGKIITEQSAPMSEPGAVRETTFEGFSIDSVQIAGMKTLTNNGLNGQGHPSFTSIVDITLTFPDGSIITRNAQITRTKILGANTNIAKDDVFAITGSVSGINRNGVDYHAEISEPLIKPRRCRWIIDGIVLMTRDGKESTVDYGFKGEACDRLALVTFEGGGTKIIRIHKRWW